MKKQSIVLRLILITGLVLALLIPLFMIQSLIYERQSYRNEAIQEINQSWSGSQVFGGPVVTLNTSAASTTAKGEEYVTTTRKHFLPEELLIDCKLIPEIRYKGIYEVVLYKSHIKASGFFQVNKSDLPAENTENYMYISLNVEDLRGIEDQLVFKWDGAIKEVVPGVKDDDIFNSGISVNIDNFNEGRHYFEIDMKLKGSEQIDFIPLGKVTKVSASSAWNNPSFTGSYLPSERKITDKSFSAKWSVNYFNRSYPQQWEEDSYKVDKSAFGLKLLMPVDEYQKSMRTSKYGILIILLTFVSFFMIEVFSKKAIHPVQYLLVGLSLVIFYSVLLSLSEYIVFHYAYIISSLLIILLIVFYVKTIYSSAKIAGIISMLLIFFYSFMYVILQLQDYSLLLGNIALFTILAVIMYLTRKINWFEIFESKVKQES